MLGISCGGPLRCSHATVRRVTKRGGDLWARREVPLAGRQPSQPGATRVVSLVDGCSWDGVDKRDGEMMAFRRGGPWKREPVTRRGGSNGGFVFGRWDSEGRLDRTAKGYYHG